MTKRTTINDARNRGPRPERIVKDKRARRANNAKARQQRRYKKKLIAELQNITDIQDISRR